MHSPLVSIIIPNYNRAQLIEETLNSIITQTYTNWEVIVVDDGSTDDSCQLVESISSINPNIKLNRRYRKPKGAPTCRNIGVEEAKGKYIIFLDSDDLLGANCLENRVAYMEQHEELAFAVFMGQLFHETVGDNPYLINIPSRESDLSRFLKQDTPWLISNPIWKATVLELLQWNEQITCFQDYMFHLQALMLQLPYEVVITEPDCFWRRGSYEAISRNNSNIAGVTSVKKVYDSVADWAMYEKRFNELKEPLQRAYIDVINRALNIGEKGYAADVLLQARGKSIFTNLQTLLLKLYIKLFPKKIAKGLNKKIVKYIFRKIFGKKIFEMQYGTFIRVRKEDFYQ